MAAAIPPEQSAQTLACGTWQIDRTAPRAAVTAEP